MILYDGGEAPEPRRVRIFLAEKAISVPVQDFSGSAANGEADLSAARALQRAPILELDDGTVITESMAICRYFEGLRPEPPLFGRRGREEALVEMWNRRVEFNLYNAACAVFYRLDRSPSGPAHRLPGRSETTEFLEMLDQELKDRLFIVSDHFTVADITALVAIDALTLQAPGVPDHLANIHRWHAQVSARPSAGA